MSKTNGTHSVENQRERLQELSADLEEARQREEELSERIAEAMAAGDQPDALREERREVRELIEDLETAIPVLRENIEHEEREKLRARAADRIRTIRKQIGGIAGQTPEMMDRAEELKEKLARTADWLWSAQYRRRELLQEARALASAFDLELPSMKSVPGNAHAAGVEAAKVKQEMKTPRAAITGDVRKVVRHLRNYYDIESPTLDLLDELEDLEAEASEAETEDREKPAAEALASPGSLPGAGYVDQMEG